jgi:hypothetical protein
MECLSKNSFQSSKVSSGQVMILTSFLRSDILLTVPPSLSGLIIRKRLIISVLNVLQYRRLRSLQYKVASEVNDNKKEVDYP